jgi:hypothetical protein
MEKAWTPARPSRPPRPRETLTALARRYHGCALALSRTLGMPLETVLRDYAAAVSTLFIEASRQGIRLPPPAILPPLHRATGGHHLATGGHHLATGDNGDVLDVSPPASNGEAHTPTTIPADGDLPCRGMEIGELNPAQLYMLLSKVAHLAHVEGDGWVPLLTSLQHERQRRVAEGQRTVAEAQP